MPGFLLHSGATVLCSHAGQAQPTAPFARVRVSGQPLTTQPAPYVVAGCPFASAPGPCVMVQWLTAAFRVRAGGMPVLLQDSVGLCAPTGVPATAVAVQARVRAM
jgi:hypothetical protein